MIVDEYIATTRVPNSEPSQEFDVIYGFIFQKLLGELRDAELEPAPVLRTVHTLNKKSELVTFGKDRYLIHDQYLGQTINQLTKIFLSTPSPDDAFAFAFRLLSETAACWGQVDLANFFALTYSIEFNKSHRYKEEVTETERLRRMISIQVQEAYIIAHEFAHHTWPHRRVDPMAMDLMIMAQHEPDNELTIDALVEAYLDDLSFQYHGERIPHSANIKTAEDAKNDVALRARYRKQFLENSQEKYNFLVQLTKDRSLHEEIYADNYAATSCLDLFASSMPVDEVLVAIHLAMENITTIGMVTEQLNRILGGEPASNARKIATRKHILRKFLESWGDENLNPEQASAFHVLKYANERYMRFVRDPITMTAMANVRNEFPSEEVLQKTGEFLRERFPNESPQFLINNCPVAL
jgi:hypothetical protein